MSKYSWCGPSKWKMKFPAFSFNRSCYLHDQDYGKAKESRIYIDLLFFVSMLKSIHPYIKKSGKPIHKKVGMYIGYPFAAVGYFLLAFFFGWWFYGKR
jgi:hypothetical protein